VVGGSCSLVCGVVLADVMGLVGALLGVLLGQIVTIAMQALVAYRHGAVDAEGAVSG
jgi:ABC-type lipoprotein release transport system permease subunit